MSGSPEPGEVQAPPGPLELGDEERARLVVPARLRQDQLEDVRGMVAAKRCCLWKPTGAGKSVVEGAIVATIKKPAAFFVPKLSLLDQFIGSAKRPSGLNECGIFPGEWSGRRHDSASFLVTTYQSLYQNPALIRAYPVVVFDEGDLVTSACWRALLDEVDHHEYAFALSAHPPKDRQRRLDLEAKLPTIRRWTRYEMYEAGAIVPVDPVLVEVPLAAEERRQHDQLAEACEALGERIGTHHPGFAARMCYRPGPLRKEASAFVKFHRARHEFLAASDGKGPALLDVVRKHPGEKVIAFSSLLLAFERPFALLERNGIRCRLLDKGQTKRERQAIFDGWGSEFQVLGTCKVAERGIDVPDASVAVFLGSGEDRAEILQRLGRVNRKSEGKGRGIAYAFYAPGTAEEAGAKAVKRVATDGR